MKMDKLFFEFESKKVGGFCYRPEGEGRFPAVIIVHGFGGGTHESKNKFMCERLAEAGFAAFMFDCYDKPNGLSEIPIENMTVSLQLKILHKIVDFVSAQSFVDKNRIGLTGHSLGGMTVMLYTPTDARIKTLVVQSGVFEFGKSQSLAFKYHPQWKKDGYKIFDKSWGNMKVNYGLIEDGLKHDVYAAVRKIKCPILVFHGDKDESIKVEQAYSIKKYLKPTDKLVIIKGADHCYKINNTLPQATKLLIEFMKEKL